MATTTIVRGRVHTRTRIETTAKRRAKARVMSLTVQGLWAFAIFFFLTHVSVSIAGHMLAEGQRAQIKTMSSSLAIARDQERVLKAESTQGGTVAAIDAWAKERGFVAPGVPTSPVKESELVAQR
jgi:hypothetical protein